METNGNRLNTNRHNWMQKLVVWYRIKQLEREFQSSERFQKYCEKIQCFNLAESEKADQEKIRKKIEGLRARH